MLNRAIEKLQNEIAGSNKYVQVVGSFLLEHILAHPDTDTAAKILPEDKTIKGSLQYMKSEARKQAVDGMAMLTEEEGYTIVLKYFGIDGPPVTASIPTVKEKSAAPPAPKKAKKKKPSDKVVNFPGTEFVQTTLDDFFSEGEF